MALKSDRTVVVWGESDAMNPVAGLNNVVAIAGGANHALALRYGPPTPVLGLQPADQYQMAGGSTTFTAHGEGLGAVEYQWLFDGTNLTGATNATLTLTNVQAGQQGDYQVIVSNDYGSITSSVAAFALLTPPVIVSLTQPTNQIPINQSSLTLAVSVNAPDQEDFPVTYQWALNGTNRSGATSSNYTFTAGAATTGTYTVTVTNAAGSTNASWQVNVLLPGNVVGWGTDSFGESDARALTNVSAIAAGASNSVAVLDDGTVVQWGYDWGDPPSGLSNVIAVSCGYSHTLALKSDGTVVSWGAANDVANTVPSGLAGVKGIAAGWYHNVALLTNGTVTAWGLPETTNVPPGLSNVTAIAAGVFHSLAVCSNGTVTAWGNNSLGQTNVPVGLSNVVAVAGGAWHSLALKSDGMVVAWGDNEAGQLTSRQD